MLSGLLLIATGGLVGSLSLCRCAPLWPSACLPAVDRSRGSKSAGGSEGLGGLMLTGCSFMAQAHDARLARALQVGDVSSACASLDVCC